MNTEQKKTIVKLRRLGVTSAIIAQAFNTTRQTIAAYVAWDTMNKGK
jgi:transcriptional regulator